MLTCTCRELKQHSSVKVINLASPGLNAECVKHCLLSLMSWILGPEVWVAGITVTMFFVCLLVFFLIMYTVQQLVPVY